MSGLSSQKSHLFALRHVVVVSGMLENWKDTGPLWRPCTIKFPLPVMTIEDHLNMAMSPDGFEAAKTRLIEEAIEIIQAMQPEELKKKWLRGAATAKNKITDANLYQFPASRNLIEELQDAFWYSVIRNAQRDD